MRQTKKLNGQIIALMVLSVFFCGVGPVFAQENGASAAGISGCVYDDANTDNIIGADERGIAGWEIILEDCGNYLIGEDGLENFSFNTQGQCMLSRSALTDDSGCYSFSGLSGGQYRVREILADGWSESYPAGFYYNIELREGEKLADIDFANFRVDNAPTAPVCGNGIKELNEICDGAEGLVDGYFCGPDCLLLPFGETEVLGESGAPDLVIGKIFNGRDEASGNIIYKIILANNGNLTAYNVHLVDRLPRGLTFAGTLSDTKTWDIGDLAPGAIEDIVYPASAGAGLPDGDYANTATVYSSNHKVISASAIFSLRNGQSVKEQAGSTDTGENVEVLGEEGAPSLKVAVAGGQRFANPGDRHIAYRVSLSNSGSLTAFGVKVVATLESGLRFSDSTGSSKQWMFDALLPDENKTIDFTIDAGQAAEPGLYSCIVSAGATNQDITSVSAGIEIRPVEVLGIESEPAITEPVENTGVALPETGVDYEKALMLILNGVLSLFIIVLLALIVKSRTESSH